MAEFVFVDKNIYKIDGILTKEDINKINTFKNRTTIILENTVGLSSELVSKIKSDRVVFSIKGGLDYDTKEKYKEQKYIDRTFVSPDGLKKIIKYFEYTEKMIDSNWNELEKAMFLYNALVVDMEYDQNYETIQSSGTTERSLNGILYGKLVCAGFAQVYKEMLDRVGVKNYYQNQKDVHAFNVIEIDGKKYGVDITWDNNDKINNNNKCGFGRFGIDPEFYTKNGHQLYKDVDISNDFEKIVLERVYDKDEEIYDLSLLSKEQLNECYNHISSKINARKSFKYNLQNQPLEIKNKYLPVDIVDYKLKQEASQDYPIVVIIDFLKSRNSLDINPQLIDSFASRKGYLIDIGNTDGKYNYNTDLSLIGINNYKIDNYGTVEFNNGTETKSSISHGIHAGYSNISEEELNNLYNQLNQYLTQYFNKNISDTIKNIDTLLENYEYKPDEWDMNRAIESDNIFTKLSIIVNSREYLIQSGISEQEVDNIIQKIKIKHNEIHEPYENTMIKMENDLDFMSALFEDLNLIWKTIEHDLKKQITQEEFISLYSNVDYMIQLFEKYILISKDNEFKFDDFDISKEDLQQILNKIIQEYQNNNLLNNSIEEQEPQNSGIHR